MPTSKIYLVGFMGSGKSTIGKVLSERLKVPFWDTDQLIVKRTGLSIKEIFSFFGEDFFRKLESDILKEVSGKEGVIATGGGVVLRETNVEIMRRTGIVVFLRISFETFRERFRILKHDRPLLNRSFEEVERLFNARTPLYEACAHVIVDVDGKDPEQAAEEVLCCLRSRSQGKTG